MKQIKHHNGFIRYSEVMFFYGLLDIVAYLPA